MLADDSTVTSIASPAIPVCVGEVVGLLPAAHSELAYPGVLAVGRSPDTTYPRAAQHRPAVRPAGAVLQPAKPVRHLTPTRVTQTRSIPDSPSEARAFS